jgi:subtilisin family serine protease
MHLFAPGENIVSTIPGNAYGIKSGTSMACPHVSGAAALLWAHAPAATYLQIKEAILAGVDKVPAAAETSITGVSVWEVVLGPAP